MTRNRPADASDFIDQRLGFVPGHRCDRLPYLRQRFPLLFTQRIALVPRGVDPLEDVRIDLLFPEDAAVIMPIEFAVDVSISSGAEFLAERPRGRNGNDGVAVAVHKIELGPLFCQGASATRGSLLAPPSRAGGAAVGGHRGEILLVGPPEGGGHKRAAGKPIQVNASRVNGIRFHRPLNELHRRIMVVFCPAYVARFATEHHVLIENAQLFQRPSGGVDHGVFIPGSAMKGDDQPQGSAFRQRLRHDRLIFHNDLALGTFERIAEGARLRPGLRIVPIGGGGQNKQHRRDKKNGKPKSIVHGEISWIMGLRI